MKYIREQWSAVMRGIFPIHRPHAALLDWYTLKLYMPEFESSQIAIVLLGDFVVGRMIAERWIKESSVWDASF